ncbi:hypothetical protein [Cytobacillus kochii]|uniref:hypothetical protein n=1 Tax=Cytobacillus kochii TaxID=859143 RepID=UPI00203C336B|nr:hypothetical protein [Cytobacillus kochii]MCM3323300.1 hypothetical protein [Cytobacillus kochii]MCM3345695.1 hypothetical protein [Cytobacillus kochii]
MNQNESQPLKNYGVKLSEPTDLISVRNIVNNPIYKHVHLSKPKLQFFEEKGYIRTYKNSRGAKYVSLKELEIFFERNFISYWQALKQNENTQDIYGNKMSPSFLNFAMEEGVEFIKRGKEILFHKISLQDFINKTNSKSYPLDLVSFNQVKSEEKYNHIKMSHDKLNTLEKKGLITTYTPSSARVKYASISELETFIEKELEESITLITFNALETSEEYKYLYLNWNKTTDLVKIGELEFAETLYGYKAVTVSSLKKYIQNLESNIEDQDLIPTSVALTTLKEKYETFKSDLTPGFLKYAITKGVHHVIKEKNILVNLDEFENFVLEFNSHWVSNNEASRTLNVNKRYLTEQREKRNIPSLHISSKNYYSRSFIDSELQRITEQNKREEEIRKNISAEQTRKEELKKLGHTASVDNAIPYVIKNGINVSTSDDLITLCSQLNIEVITGNNKKKLIHWKNLRKIVNEYVPFIFKKKEIINFCREKSISLFSINNLAEKIIHKDDFELLLSHFFYSNDESRRLLSASYKQFNKIIQDYIEHQDILMIKNEERYFPKELIGDLVFQQKTVISMNGWVAKRLINTSILNHYPIIRIKINVLKQRMPLF